ncbi:MOSC domain-containing protein [Duganella callida]|uniref:MOSC domain-containing protein n=1 Tax=Duganella callida TaxID=2561932 RepID=A0A4Y9S9Q1_9BURK|nr:MOSC domain-containing protein [Duganella callida]TFW16810.1 hypothetical protein E4L98_22425 [Duganella callida]
MPSQFPTSPIGIVDTIYVKPTVRSPFRPVDAAEAVEGLGFSNDVHQDRASPRQLLLASAAAYTELNLPEHILRENLRITADTSRLHSGQLLRIGESVTLALTFQCEACGRLGPGVAGTAKNRRGMLARVVKGGTVRKHDPIFCVGTSAVTWSDNWQDRVEQVLRSVPDGFVIEFSQIARLAGIQSSYCRAFPALLKRLAPCQAQKAVPANGPGLRWAGGTRAAR